MKNIKHIRKKTMGILMILFFIISIIFTSNLVSFGLATIQEEDISIEWGDNVYQNLPYTYAGTFYDDADFTFAWTTSKIEYQYIPDSTVTYSHSITDFENQETQYPTNASISMINGTHYQNGTLNSLDDDYHIFNSTYNVLIPEQPSAFTLINGTSNFEGNIEFIDSNYTMFNSTEAGHYPGNYSFREDIVGATGVEIGFVDVVDGGGNIIIQSGRGTHNKVLNVDNVAGAQTRAIHIFSTSQTGTATVEFWHQFGSSAGTTSAMHFYSDTTLAIQLYAYAGGLYYVDLVGTQQTILTEGTLLVDTWYDFRITFDIIADRFDCYVNGELEQNDGEFRFVVSDIDDIRLGVHHTTASVDTWWDGYGEDWDPNYSIGDNENPIPTLVNFTVDLNLDTFSSLDDLNLVYSYRTNISQIINLSIYNFDNSEYDLIEFAVNLTFQNYYFGLNSSYYNATNDLILKFGMSNSTEVFRLDIDRLVIRHSSYLNFTTYVDFEILTNLLGLDIESYQRSSIKQLINISAWDWDNEEWDLLSSSSYITTFQLADYSSSTVFDEYIDNSTGQVLLSYYGANKTDAFEFHLDQLKFDIYFKTEFEYEKILYLLGTWKYRFVLDDGLGTEYNQDWIYFNVIEQNPNFEGISESKYATRWILTSTATSGHISIIYTDDLTNGLWDLSDTSQSSFLIAPTLTGDAYISQDFPDNNYGSGYTLMTGNFAGEIYYSYVASVDNFGAYIGENISTSALSIWVDSNGWNDISIDIFTTDSFDEGTITWNNKPDLSDIACDQYYIGSYNTRYTIPLSENSYYYAVVPDGVDTGQILYPSKEEAPFYRPKIQYHLNKNFHNTSGEGYAYIETNTTETLGLISPSFSNISLSEGDYFTVDLETVSDNAQLKLYNNGVLQKTLTLLIANTETSRQEVEVYIDSDVSFDQVKIISELSDTEYFKLYDIQGNHWVFESEADQKSMYVEPFGQNEIITNYGNNTLKIYENNILQVETYVDIGYDLITYVFESTLPETVFVSFFDLNNEYLDFNQFKVYVNYTLYEELYTNQRLTNREFFVDEGSTIYFEVNDSFNVNIYFASRLAKTFMDITLNVYSLKIKNEATKEISYILTKGSISKSGWILPEEIIEYFIATGSYQLDYVNYEDMALRTYNFSLNEHSLITINTTYHTVYFALFNFDGLGLDRDLFRFYINGLRKNFGFNTLKQNVNNLKVLDYFNATLLNQAIDLSGYREYSIYVEVWTMILYNNYSFPVKMKIERNDIEVEQVIETGLKFHYRMLPKVEYIIEIFHLNGTLLETREIELEENNQVVSFGFYEEEVPEYPSFDNTSITIILIILIFIGIISLTTYFVYKYNKRVQNLKVAYARQHTVDKDLIEGAVRPRSSRMKRIK